MAATQDRNKTSATGATVSMKVSPMENDLLDAILLQERKAAGPYAAGVTKASYLRRLFLDDAAARGLKPDDFIDAPPPAPEPPQPSPPLEPTIEEATLEHLATDLRAALDQALDDGLPMRLFAEDIGVARARISEFRAGLSIGQPSVRLPQLAAALRARGYPKAVQQPEP